MRDTGKIIIGIIVFIAIAAFPVWYNVAKGRATYTPDLEIVTRDVPGRDHCVADTMFMRTEHTKLLNEWRNLVVREGQRVYTAPDGRKFNMSLSQTCLDCHSNKDKFCDRCHDYMKVDPYCWDCHNVPGELVE